MSHEVHTTDGNFSVSRKVSITDVISWPDPLSSKKRNVEDGRIGGFEIEFKGNLSEDTKNRYNITCQSFSLKNNDNKNEYELRFIIVSALYWREELNPLHAVTGLDFRLYDAKGDLIESASLITGMLKLKHTSTKFDAAESFATVTAVYEEVPTDNDQ